MCQIVFLRLYNLRLIRKWNILVALWLTKWTHFGRFYDKKAPTSLSCFFLTANVFVVNYTTFRSVPFPGQFLSYFLLLIVVYYKSSYSYSSTTKLSYFLLLIIVYYELSYFTLVRQDCRTFYYELSYSKLDYIFCTTNM